jgi:hypothetical protein
MKAGKKPVGSGGKMTKAQMARVHRRLVREAFALWKETGRLRAGDVCEKCGAVRGALNSRGKKTVLDTHHVIIREVKSLRFDPNNCCVLCQNCHKFDREGAHRGTVVFSDWFRLTRARDYEYVLSERMNRPVESVEDIRLAIAQMALLKCSFFSEMLRNVGVEGIARE